ncbi:MAG: hypothetical protein ACJZ8O_08835 [Pirellulaceae bacterium]
MTNPESPIDQGSHDRKLPRAVGKRLLFSSLGLCFLLLVVMEIKARRDDYRVNYYPPSTDLWVAQWLELENSLPPDQTVVIGASRMQFGVIVPEWKKLTGKNLHILAFPGAPPGPVLEKLAELDAFHGTVLCGFAPPFSFSHEDTPNRERMEDNIKAVEPSRYSLSHHLSMAANEFLIPKFKFMNSFAYSPVLLSYSYWPIPNREGTLLSAMFPFAGSLDCDLQFRFARNIREIMRHEIVAQIQESTRKVIGHYGTIDIEQLLMRYKDAVRKIESRGGRVIFVRPPSDGKFLAFEREHNAREKFYDRIVNETGCFGIHFEDYPELEELQCVEDSHLDVEDGLKYTRRLVRILQQENLID